MKKLISFLLIVACSCSAFGQVTVVGSINTNGVAAYPTHYDSLQKGGYRVVADIEERDFIPTLRRKLGMLVYTQEDSTMWQLRDPTLGNANWIVSGGSTFDSIEVYGPYLELIPSTGAGDYQKLKTRQEAFDSITKIVLTTDGSSGPATWDSITRSLNIPQYSGSGGTVQSVTGDLVNNSDPANPVVNLPYKIISGFLVQDPSDSVVSFFNGERLNTTGANLTFSRIGPGDFILNADQPIFGSTSTSNFYLPLPPKINDTAYTLINGGSINYIIGQPTYIGDEIMGNPFTYHIQTGNTSTGLADFLLAKLFGYYIEIKIHSSPL
ncbi:MAG: hypothetical protein ABIQ31_05790 [Ferruginibacter sp.]